MPTFRNQVDRDKAWGRYFAKLGLRPVTSDIRTVPNAMRIANYIIRRARYEAALSLSRSTVKF